MSMQHRCRKSVVPDARVHGVHMISVCFRIHMLRANAGGTVPVQHEWSSGWRVADPPISSSFVVDSFNLGPILR